ncbi:MAG: hypothetical protein CBB67_015835 [Alteromonadaceae bacterium TMED7]|jgi:hypothetical protein|uniref:hypothetical protein n=1 Tax=uncultured Alteromonas sp. TaxID=179113 RepID=UPI000B6D9B84|nr:hypothetical protein [uncultured Alteromonas sp.]RPH16173.1 MAG: hypothetical protein CBB67_015835 [Alteromonadaceae bacterium TMED7]|tara:strand:- start:3520 stop:4539 length:1020 start_codon:yes stop_codon:yes gene_type:complete
MLKSAQIVAHQTRLFPKNQGADNYLINGIAARCDWVVLSDLQAPQTALVKRKSHTPKTVFLSLRAPFVAIKYFYDEVLPQLTAPFVLVSGSEDITVPNQTDKRWRVFNDQEQAMIEAILAHPNLIHWYAENLDDASQPGMSPLPLGLVHHESDATPDLVDPNPVPLRNRPNTVLCAHRIRDGEQWAPREQVSKLASTYWGAFCRVIDEEVSLEEYFTALHQHSFVLCVEGGGIDPSPKAWHALLNGTIPIIRSPGLRAAYQKFPVVFVDDWSADSLNEARLAKWKEVLQPWYDEPILRQQVMYKLGLDYWWDSITSHYMRHAVAESVPEPARPEQAEHA